MVSCPTPTAHVEHLIRRVRASSGIANWLDFWGHDVVGKLAHVIFVIFLMAGLFMMPLYLSSPMCGGRMRTKWIEREDRPQDHPQSLTLVIVWILGLMLAFNGGYWSQGWFHAKLTALSC